MFARLNSDGLEQNLGRDVMGVGDERHTHPRANRIILAANAARMDAGPETEDEGDGDGQDESQAEEQRPPPDQRHPSTVSYGVIREVRTAA